MFPIQKHTWVTLWCAHHHYKKNNNNNNKSTNVVLHCLHKYNVTYVLLTNLYNIIIVIIHRFFFFKLVIIKPMPFNIYRAASVLFTGDVSRPTIKIVLDVGSLVV